MTHSKLYNNTCNTGRKMKIKAKKRLVLIGIRRKGEPGFKIKTTGGEPNAQIQKRN